MAPLHIVKIAALWILGAAPVFACILFLNSLLDRSAPATTQDLYANTSQKASKYRQPSQSKAERSQQKADTTTPKSGKYSRAAINEHQIENKYKTDSASAKFKTPPPPAISIAIILDDIGNQWASSQRSALLDGDITLAVLPYSPYAQKAAELAEAQGKEVMLHAPMEPIGHAAWDGGLTQDMSEDEVKAALSDMLNRVPLARGVNNHMGSAFTQNQRAMQWVMQALADRDLYFVDSRTSALSKGLKAAKARAIPSLKRDVFLDNQRDEQAIAEQINKLISKAKKQGYAVGIGHPYPETLNQLSQLNALLQRENIRLVKVSNLLQHYQQLAAQHQKSINSKIN